MSHENRQYGVSLTSSAVLFYDLAAWFKVGVYLGRFDVVHHNMSMLPKDHRS